MLCVARRHCWFCCTAFIPIPLPRRSTAPSRSALTVALEGIPDIKGTYCLTMSTNGTVEKGEQSEFVAEATQKPTTSENAGESVVPRSKSPDTAESSEEIDEEEALLVSIEKQKEEEEAEEAAHPHAQPKDISSAPKLLQDALKKGQVKPDESEEEEEEAAVGKVAATGEEEKKGDEGEALSPARHYHTRVSRYILPFLPIFVVVCSDFLAVLSIVMEEIETFSGPLKELHGSPKRKRMGELVAANAEATERSLLLVVPTNSVGSTCTWYRLTEFCCSRLNPSFPAKFFANDHRHSF